ncbi:YraN family protein [Billgrantia sp. C5P2]|uniref:YraN family protein n=1 Tax=Billgrantia sp. C5P2 TaxID=3436239 RepID=UPI003DA4359C
MASSADARARGARIERVAAEWLTTKGLRLIASNQQFKGGEIDLVMGDGETLVFVEVRHRADTRHGHPLETVTATKQRRLVHAARFYLARNRLSCPCRFDVLAVTGTPPALDFEWVQGAFEAF